MLFFVGANVSWLFFDDGFDVANCGFLSGLNDFALEIYRFWIILLDNNIDERFRDLFNLRLEVVFSSMKDLRFGYRIGGYNCVGLQYR